MIKIEYRKKISELRKEFLILETHETKPNYAELARKYNIDRRVIKKYRDGYSGKPAKRSKPSALDQYYDEIKTKLELPGAKMMSTYQFLLNKYPNIGKYHNFVRFANKHGLKPQKSHTGIHPRFETPFGKQLQFDWKESIKMYNKHGVLFEFNVFTATLSASRMHALIYSKYRTREDVERCLIESYIYFGGITDEALTDRMSSIFNNHSKNFHPEFIAFAKDLGFIPKKCQSGRAQTKGKDESANRFVNWLVPYNYEFETEEDLINIIKEINKKINLEVNSTTGLAPIAFYQKERNYLKPLPNKNILDSYLVNAKQYIVPEDFLLYYRGSSYSVSPKYIGKKVKLKEVDKKLHIYHENKLISTHELKKQKINYTPEHYMAGLSEVMPYKTTEEIEAIAEENLKLFDQLGSN